MKNKNRPTYRDFEICNLDPSLKMSTYQLLNFEVWTKKSKIVLPAVILEKKILTPNFTKFLNP